MRDCVYDWAQFSVFHTALQMMVSTLIMSSSPACISSAGVLSTPSEIPFLGGFVVSSTSDLRVES